MLWLPGKRQQFERSMGQTHWLISESLLERHEAPGTYLEDRDTGGSHLGDIILLWAPLWNPPSRLLALGCDPGHELVIPSPGKLQSKQTDVQKHSPTYQQTHYHRTTHQRAKDSASVSATCGPGLALGLPGPLSQLTQDLVTHW